MQSEPLCIGLNVPRQGRNRPSVSFIPVIEGRVQYFKKDEMVIFIAVGDSLPLMLIDMPLISPTEYKNVFWVMCSVFSMMQDCSY